MQVSYGVCVQCNHQTRRHASMFVSTSEASVRHNSTIAVDVNSKEQINITLNH